MSKGAHMTETIYPSDGDPVQLRPCPAWCIEAGRHFLEDVPVHADDGFHHYGPETAVQTSYREMLNDPETVVKVSLKAWTHPMDAEPGPVTLDLQFATAEDGAHANIELTPGEARTIAAALIKLADTAADPKGLRP